ncbi:unnamed protein product, partial [Staurois parvus]
MISIAPAVPPVSVHQCQLSVPINATCKCPSVPHQCPSELPFSVAQSVPLISDAYQCHPVSPISASQCCLSVPPVN